MKTAQYKSIPWLLLIGSFALRLSLISKGPYNVDCLNLTMKAEELLATGNFGYVFGPGYPLTIIICAFFVKMGRLFGCTDSVLMVNFMSVFFSALCAPLMYWIGKRLDTWTGVISALILSLTPIVLGVSQYGKSHTPSLFFLLCGVLLLLRYKENKSLSSLLWAALLIGCMAAARVQDMILLTPALSFLIVIPNWDLSEKKKFYFVKQLKTLSLFWLIVGVIATIFHIPYFLGKETSIYGNNLSAFWLSGVTNNFRGLISPYLKRSFSYLFYSFNFTGMLCALFGIIILAIRKKTWSFFLILWFIIPLAFYGNVTSSAPRFFVIICPAISLWIAHCLSRFLNHKGLFRIVSFIILSMILFIPLYQSYPAFYYRHKNASLPDYSYWLRDMTEKNARIIITDFTPFINYYSHRQVQGRILKDHVPIKESEILEHKQELDDILQQNIPLYITDTGLYGYDYYKIYSTFIKNNYDIELIGGKWYEDWHRGELQHLKFVNKLYRIRPKGNLTPEEK